ncbi:large ribosomal subunit protein mL41 isoform X4 [Heptranchias perlo]|uniref:large ribosomal subunit protein mL41 isoform X4 n=1 Tax=Heptranchias perlo TaxID=212740 RepID=UPI003559856A
MSCPLHRTCWSKSSSMEVAITLIDKPREDSAVEDFDRETPRNCNLETIFSNGSDACRVEASTREAYACDGVEGDAAPLCPKSSKGTRQEISFSKTSLGKEERSRGPNIIKPDEMNRLQKMLSQANRLTPCFPERRLYHPSSHFIGRDSPLLQRSPSAALRLRLPASSSRGQLKSNYRSPVFPARKHHKNSGKKRWQAGLLCQLTRTSQARNPTPQPANHHRRPARQRSPSAGKPPTLRVGARRRGIKPRALTLLQGRPSSRLSGRLHSITPSDRSSDLNRSPSCHTRATLLGNRLTIMSLPQIRRILFNPVRHTTLSWQIGWCSRTLQPTQWVSVCKESGKEQGHLQAPVPMMWTELAPSPAIVVPVTQSEG